MKEINGKRSIADVLMLILSSSEVEILFSDCRIKDWEIFLEFWIVFEEFIEEFKHLFKFLYTEMSNRIG